MHIMISHDHREKQLAEAWKTLLQDVSHLQLEPWYSSDTRPEGGVGTGQWWNILHSQIEESAYVVSLLTRSSADRPWIIWECGLASGQSNTRGIIPITFGLGMANLTGPLAGFQAYRGDQYSDVLKVCQILCKEVGLENLDERLFAPAINTYLQTINTFFAQDELSKLFSSDFHKKDATLEGEWEATWYDEQGNVFETDTFTLYMYDNLLRIVGQGAKGYTYPMEGRLSADRFISLTYWSQAHITLSGVVLLRVSPSGLKMKGQWIGHTTSSFDEDELRTIHGKVECTKRVR